jgi:hypothetical protein
MPTARTCELAPGRLFPSEDFGNGWQMSAQADVGYQCEPRKFLPHLEDYESVEVKIDGPHGMLVDPTTLGLPEAIAAKFTPLDTSHCPSLGCCITHAELAVLRDVLREAHLDPSAGIPPGRIGWANQTVWLAADGELATNVETYGLEEAIAPQGDFGEGVRLAECHGDAEAEVEIAFEVEDGAVILDLRNPSDRRQWQDHGREGVDGIFDPGVGLVVFNLECVSRDQYTSGYRR